MATEHTARFVKSGETLGTIKYKEVGTTHVGTLYVKKATAIDLGSPESLEVTIKAGK